MRVSNGLDPDQERPCVGPDLCPNCLPRLSVDDKSCHEQGIVEEPGVKNVKNKHLGMPPFYTPPLKCGEVLCYTLRCLSVCPSVRAHHFRSIT